MYALYKRMLNYKVIALISENSVAYSILSVICIFEDSTQWLDYTFCFLPVYLLFLFLLDILPFQVLHVMTNFFLDYHSRSPFSFIREVNCLINPIPCYFSKCFVQLKAFLRLYERDFLLFQKYYKFLAMFYKPIGVSLRYSSRMHLVFFSFLVTALLLLVFILFNLNIRSFCTISLIQFHNTV